MEIHDLLIDDANEDEFAKHGISVREVLQVLDEAPQVFRNKGSENAPYVVVGPTHGGRLLFIPIDPTIEPDTWRPRTAFDAPQEYRTKYEHTAGGPND